MSTDEVPKTMAAMARLASTASLSTLGNNGLRSRLVHPVWDSGGTSGYLLTDATSPKVDDLSRCSRVALTYFHRDTWVLVAADTAIEDNPAEVAIAVDDCATRDEGYSPADFWTGEELRRLVVVQLSPSSIDMARFKGSELEESSWRNPTNNPNPS